MGYSLDFAKIKKNFLTVKLLDGTTLFVNPPQKHTFDTMTALAEHDGGTPDEVYAAIAQVLSNNKQKRAVTVDEVADFDSQDIQTFFKAYQEFVLGEKNNPN